MSHEFKEIKQKYISGQKCIYCGILIYNLGQRIQGIALSFIPTDFLFSNSDDVTCEEFGSHTLRVIKQLESYGHIIDYKDFINSDLYLAKCKVCNIKFYYYRGIQENWWAYGFLNNNKVISCDLMLMKEALE